MAVGQLGKNDIMIFNKTILIVGFGSIGRRHTNNILKITDSKIIIFTKRKNIPKDEFFDHNLNFKRITVSSNLDNCLKYNPAIAFVTNETSLHSKNAIKLAKKGLDLFIEKPLSNTLKNLSELKKITKKNDLIVMVGCNFRFFPPFKKIKREIESERVGKLLSIQCENSSFLPDWHPNEDYSKSYAARKNLGGGVTLTQIHELDYLTWFFGPLKKISSVVRKISDLQVDSDDICICILESNDKKLIELHLDFFSKPFFKRIKIRGTKGILIWDSDKNHINFFNYKTSSWKLLSIKNNYSLTSKFTNNMYLDELKYFLKCVSLRKEPMNNLSESEKILKVALDLKS